MDGHMILDAVGMIDDQYIISAQRRLGEVPHRRTGSRVLIGAAAAVLLLVSSFVTAMAASEAFQEKVFEFFHIPAAESGVSVKTLHVGKELTLIGNGTMYEAEYDETGNVRGVSFYQIAEDNLRAVPTSVSTFQLDAGGVPVNGEVYWCRADGEISVIGTGRTTERSRTWKASAVGQRTDVVLLSVYSGLADQFDFYAFLLDLGTGDTKPLFSDTGLCRLTHVQEIQLTSDCGYALVLGRLDHDLEGVPYLYHLPSRQLISLREAAGTEGIDTAYLMDDDTVLLTSLTDREYTCWCYSILEAAMQKTIDGMPVDSGRMVSFGSQYVFWVNEDGAAEVIDQKTGLRSPAPEGFPYDDRSEVLLSGDGRKVCGVLPGSLHMEAFGWIDEDRVGVSVTGGQTDLYVYELEGD